MTRSVTLLHGFNVRDGGAGSIDRLMPSLENGGFRVLEFDYGWVGRLGVRLYTDRFAQILAGMVPDGSFAIGHSNGCHVINQALREHGAPLKRVVYIAPALDANTPLPPQVEQCLVLYSPSDWATKIARWIPFSGWGGMGHRGYLGPEDDRVISEDFNQLLYPGLPDVGHSDYFDPAIVGTTQRIVRRFLDNGEL